MKKFPSEIMVMRDSDADVEWLTAYEDKSDLEGLHGETVAIYKLVRTAKVNIDISLK